MQEQIYDSIYDYTVYDMGFIFYDDEDEAETDSAFSWDDFDLRN